MTKCALNPIKVYRNDGLTKRFRYFFIEGLKDNAIIGLFSKEEDLKENMLFKTTKKAIVLSGCLSSSFLEILVLTGITEKQIKDYAKRD